MAALLSLLLCWLTAAAPAEALRLPGRAAPEPPSLAASGANGAASGRLQEVAPPAAVQQLQAALAERQPQVEILEPRDGSVLDAGSWTLRLAVHDWPLVDAGALGLGPHLVVQLDGEPPQPVTATEITLAALSPGSHRLTVYAARPWGEAVKSPGAQAQIRLHRAAVNPLALPAAGSPQLIPVQPAGTTQAAADPVLLDWLLLDAPLQHLRAGDESWRLRVTVNGDSFLVDQAAPLWLRGWRRGSNAVLLELLDGRGEPLNPPFNSVVAELNVAPGSRQPAWLRGPLTVAEQAMLLGEASPDSLTPSPPEPDPAAMPGEVQDSRSAAEADTPAAGPAVVDATTTEEAATEAPATQNNAAEAGATEEGAAEDRTAEDSAPADTIAPPEPAAAEETVAAGPSTSDGAPPDSAAESPEVARADNTATALPGADSPSPPASAPSPSRARDQVRADGTLIRPEAEGPLARLRNRLQR